MVQSGRSGRPASPAAAPCFVVSLSCRCIVSGLLIGARPRLLYRWIDMSRTIQFANMGNRTMVPATEVPATGLAQLGEVPGVAAIEGPCVVAYAVGHCTAATHLSVWRQTRNSSRKALIGFIASRRCRALIL